MTRTDPSAEDSLTPAVKQAEQALHWMRHAHAEDELVVEIQRQVSQRRRRRVAIATGALAVAVAVGIFWSTFLRKPEASPLVASTTAIVTLPQQRTLSDGSRVELNEDAAIVVDFSGPLRRVALQRGEAHFQVA